MGYVLYFCHELSHHLITDALFQAEHCRLGKEHCGRSNISSVNQNSSLHSPPLGWIFSIYFLASATWVLVAETKSFLQVRTLWLKSTTENWSSALKSSSMVFMASTVCSKRERRRVSLHKLWAWEERRETRKCRPRGPGSADPPSLILNATDCIWRPGFCCLSGEAQPLRQADVQGRVTNVRCLETQCHSQAPLLTDSPTTTSPLSLQTTTTFLQMAPLVLNTVLFFG